MGFYGNITNTGRTHFQFDFIFENRRQMDIACLSGTDNIFAGRFVAISYDRDSKFTSGDILSGFRGISDSSKIYADVERTKEFYYTTFQVVNSASAANWDQYYWSTNGFFIKLPGESYYSAEEAAAGHYYTPAVQDSTKNLVTEGQLIRLFTEEDIPTETFLRCASGTNGQVANFTPIILDQAYPRYLTNYNIDKQYYGVDQALRGYDGTVWQKIYSEGQGKFILIARLNGMMPGLELFPDQPSLFPSAPYIDSKSSEALYRIHVPSHWGFRIREADMEYDASHSPTYPLSDQIVQQTYGNYDASNHLLSTNTREINADIYYNKKAANKEYNYIDTETQNEILIEPTGQSGKRYFDENGEPQYEDTYELSVHLPVVGNMIADGYNLIYGYNQQTQTSPQQRFTDIDWIDGSYSPEEKYYGLSNKKTHDLNTLAGTLNTMHDRLGQIICHTDEPPAQIQVNDLSFDSIYESYGSFYRRGIKYKKITIGDYIYTIDPDAGSHFASREYYTYSQNAYGDPVYTLATSYHAGTTYYKKDPWCRYDADPHASTQFSTNKYYENTGTTANPVYTPSQDTTYNSSKTYYLKNINASRFARVELTKYEPGQFYYLEGESYMCDLSNPNPYDLHRTYYTISPVPSSQLRTFSSGYEPNKYYRLNSETGAYEKDTSAIPDPLDNRPYYDVDNTTKTAAFNGQACIIYLPNQFYRQDKTNLDDVELCTEPTITQEMFQRYNFYVFYFSDIPQYGRDLDGNIIQYYERVGQAIDISSVLKLPESGVQYYYIDPNGQYVMPYENLYKLDHNAYTVTRIYYTMSTPNMYPVDSLYLPGRYYIREQVSSGPTRYSYIKANGPYDEHATYCVLLSSNISVVPYPFYIQHKYYYEVSTNLYELDDSIVKVDNRIYYTKAGFYVDRDEANECPHGYEWSEYAAYIPPSVTLYAREEYPAVIPMDMAFTGNSPMTTINGALLYLHQNYDPLNDETRDVNTFRGTLNSIKDLLYQIKKLIPGRICYVNSFGQITASDITYDQLKQLIH